MDTAGKAAIATGITAGALAGTYTFGRGRLRIVSVSINGGQPVSAGSQAMAIVQVANDWIYPQNVSVSGVTLDHAGLTVGHWVPVSPTTDRTSIPAGKTYSLTFITAGPIADQYAGENLTARFTVNSLNGRPYSQVFSVQQLAPVFEIVGVELITNPVEPGQYARAIISIKNTGTAAGTTLVTGVSTLNGVQKWTWD